MTSVGNEGLSFMMKIGSSCKYKKPRKFFSSTNFVVVVVVVIVL